MNFITPAYAQAAGGGAGGAEMLMQMAPFAIILVIMYFLIIRPQQKQRKKQEEFLKALKAGDRVVLASGLIGRIASLQNDIAVIELDKDVRVKVLKSQIATQYQEPGEARS